MKKLLSLISLLAALLAVPVQAAEFCTPVNSTSDYFALTTGGKLSLSGTICNSFSPTFQLESFKWNGTLTFNNFNPPNAKDFTATGAITFALNFTAATGLITAAYNGPLTYTYLGQTYNVQYNNLSFVLGVSNGSIKASSVSGSVTVNGTELKADPALLAFLL